MSQAWWRHSNRLRLWSLKGIPKRATDLGLYDPKIYKYAKVLGRLISEGSKFFNIMKRRTLPTQWWWEGLQPDSSKGMYREIENWDGFTCDSYTTFLIPWSTGQVHANWGPLVHPVVLIQWQCCPADFNKVSYLYDCIGQCFGGFSSVSILKTFDC